MQIRFFICAVILSVFQPLQQRPVVIYNAPADDVHNLRITTTGDSPGTLLRVLLVDRANANRFWEITRIFDGYEYGFKVERADRQSVVLSRVESDYGTPA